MEKYCGGLLVEEARRCARSSEYKYGKTVVEVGTDDVLQVSMKFYCWESELRMKAAERAGKERKDTRHKQSKRLIALGV